MGIQHKLIDPPHEMTVEFIELLGDNQYQYCEIELPDPAIGCCGVYKIECTKCGRRATVPVSGRGDDPRTYRVGCGQQRRWQ
jgi:hypothetical protein